MALLLAVTLVSPARAESVRYFAVWSYTQNEPSNEIESQDLGSRTLGYWQLSLDDEGRLDEATYHGSNGTRWLSVRYVEEGDYLYADVYNGDGLFVVRKSTQLTDRRPVE